MRTQRRALERRREVYLRKLGVFLMVLLLLSGGLLYNGIRSMASETEEKHYAQCYASVIIPEGGDWMSVVAEQYGLHETASQFRDLSSYRKEVLRINGLQEIRGEVFPQLNPGDALLLPYVILH